MTKKLTNLDAYRLFAELNAGNNVEYKTSSINDFVKNNGLPGDNSPGDYCVNLINKGVRKDFNGTDQRPRFFEAVPLGNGFYSYKCLDEKDKANWNYKIRWFAKGDITGIEVGECKNGVETIDFSLMTLGADSTIQNYRYQKCLLPINKIGALTVNASKHDYLEFKGSISNSERLSELAECNCIDFYQVDSFCEVLKRLPSLFERKTEKCFVSFLSSSEMKKYEDESISLFEQRKKIIFDKIGQVQKLLNGLSVFNDLREKIFNVLDEIKEHVDEEDRITEIYEMLKSLIDTLREYPKEIHTDGNLLIDRLDEILKNLTFINPIKKLLGLYVYNKRTIFLCLDNVVQSAKKYVMDYMNSSNKSLNTDDLIELFASELAVSVLCHEYAHHLHINLMRRKSPESESSDESVKYHAVLETVAETIQFLFAKKIFEANCYNDDIYEVLLGRKWKGGPIIDWMERHTSAGLFPGWGYKGAKIVIDAAKKISSTEKLLDYVIEKSLDGWNEAYAVIEFLQTI